MGRNLFRAYRHLSVPATTSTFEPGTGKKLKMTMRIAVFSASGGLSCPKVLDRCVTNQEAKSTMTKNRMFAVVVSMCAVSASLLLSGCTDSRVGPAIAGVTGWVDQLVLTPADDSALQVQMAKFPKLVQELQDALRCKPVEECTITMMALKTYMYQQFPKMPSELTDAQKLYIVFGVKREAWNLDRALETSEMGHVGDAISRLQTTAPTEEKWRHFIAAVLDVNGNGIADINDPAMKWVRNDLMGLPIVFSPYDHTGLLRHLADDVGPKARYHGLVAVDQEIPAFASVAEAADFLATNPYLHPASGLPQTKAATTAVDSDGDGLSDVAEINGWTVTVIDGYGNMTTRHVTSDPNNPDTDGDGLTDAEENTYQLDPGNLDTDSDGINDYDELNVYMTNPTSLDSDCDCRGFVVNTQVGLVTYENGTCDPSMYDGAEVANSTSPTNSDTDGDALSDWYERYHHLQPRVADVPQLQVTVNGDPSLTINGTAGTTNENTAQTLTSTENTHSESTTNSWDIGAKLSAAYGGGGKLAAGAKSKPKGGKGLSASGELSGGYSHTKETTDTTTSLVQNMNQTVTTHTAETTGYTLTANVTVTNVSNTPLSATVTNLVIDCTYQVPDGTNNPPALKYLEMAPSAAWSGWTIPPGTSTPSPQVLVTGSENSAAAAAEITNAIGSGAPIKFTVAQCAMNNSSGSKVDNIMENVMQQDCSITLDFGPYDPDPNVPDSATGTPPSHKPKAYYVAANLPAVVDGEVKFGVTLANALALAGIPSSGYVLAEDGSLTQLLGWPADPAAHPNGHWFVSSSSDSLVPDPQNPGFFTYGSFDQIWLAGMNPNYSSKPDYIDIVWVDDQDGDGLSDALEACYGTDPTKTDTDGDGLSDQEEINGVLSGTNLYYTSPLLADTDGDGLNDDVELNTWFSNPLVASYPYFNSMSPTCSGVFSGSDFERVLSQTGGANVFPGDFNGDGIGDFLRQEKGGFGSDKSTTVQIFYGDGAGNFTDVELSMTNGNSMNPDDIFRFDPGRIVTIGDFNGDKCSDILLQTQNGLVSSNGGTNVLMLLSTGDKSAKFNVTGISNNDSFGDWNSTMRSGQGARIYAGDFNGDGITDVLRQEYGPWDNDTTDTAIVYYGAVVAPTIQFTGVLMTSTGTLGNPQLELQADPGAKIILGDFNGDGKCDFIRQVWSGTQTPAATGGVEIYFATATPGHFNVVDMTSTGYFTAPQTDLNYDSGAYIIPGDFNGDGKCDFIRQAHGGWVTSPPAGAATATLYIGKGDGSFASSPLESTGYLINPQVELSGDACLLSPYDFNNDGRCDFMRQRIDNTGTAPDNALLYFFKGYKN